MHLNSLRRKARRHGLHVVKTRCGGLFGLKSSDGRLLKMADDVSVIEATLARLAR